MPDSPNTLSEDTLTGVILAAGAATRFAAPKQLESIGGLKLVVRAVRTAASVCRGPVLVITGAYHDEVVEALAGEPARAVYNPAWREGMGASLRQAAAVVDPTASALLVLLADQVAVMPKDLAALRDAWAIAPDQLAAAWYQECAGVPAIFPRAWIPRLARLHGDSGARNFLRNAHSVTRVPMPAAAVDIDTPEALQRYRAGSS